MISIINSKKAVQPQINSRLQYKNERIVVLRKRSTKKKILLLTEMYVGVLDSALGAEGLVETVDAGLEAPLVSAELHICLVQHVLSSLQQYKYKYKNGEVQG